MGCHRGPCFLPPKLTVESFTSAALFRAYVADCLLSYRRRRFGRCDRTLSSPAQLPCHQPSRSAGIPNSAVCYLLAIVRTLLLVFNDQLTLYFYRSALTRVNVETRNYCPALGNIQDKPLISLGFCVVG